MSETKAAGGPWHLWVVAIIALLWNGLGCYLHFTTMTNPEQVMREAQLPERVAEYYLALPAWMGVAWGVGVWGGVIGAVLLLARSKWALHAFIVSLVAFVSTLVYYYALSNGRDILGTTAMPQQAMIFLSCVIFIWYAHFATKRGILR